MVVGTRRKFTIAEYHQLVDLGFFTENDRIELIRGEIIETAPKRTPHSVCNSTLFGELYRLLPAIDLFDSRFYCARSPKGLASRHNGTNTFGLKMLVINNTMSMILQISTEIVCCFFLQARK